MGTKAGGKRPSSSRVDDTSSAAVEQKRERKKRRWLPKIFRDKSKYRTLSEEHLHDIDGPSSTASVEPHHEVKDDRVGESVGELSHDYDYKREVSIEENAEIVTESVLQGDCRNRENVDGTTGVGETTSDKSASKPSKKTSLGSTLRRIKDSFNFKKRRRQSTNYAKFSGAESTDDLTTISSTTTAVFSTCAPSSDTKTSLPKSGSGQLDSTLSNSPKNTILGKKRNKSSRYVRFMPDIDGNANNIDDTDDDDDDNENKENIDMCINERCIADQQPEESTAPKKKKKSARKRVAKAGKTTGRVLGVGLLHVGKNLQYLSPIPTANTFSSSRSTSTSTSRNKNHRATTKDPKKRSYKYTASAPPPNPYAFI